MDVFNLRDPGTAVRIDVPIPFAASLANMTDSAVISDLEDACPVIG